MNNRPANFGGSLLLALLLAGAGCNQDPYGYVVIGDAILPSLPEAGSICQLTNGGVEICDGVDNNCDGQIDEEFNTLTNPRHCGKCNNSCLLTGAVTDCNMGECVFISCAPGFFDLNSDLGDGCEYECTPTGDELCDEVDNNCNGKIDEAFDLDTDVANCGTCGHSCLLANAVPKCVEGECLIHQCEPGFIDQDEDPASGCEEPCTVSNSGIEACDGQDNDCNGVVDDPNGIPIDFKSDPFNCGACGVTCTLPNAEVTCQGSKCMISQCEGDFVNADGVEDNGCECSPLDGSGQPLVEVCDGADNDCNGLIDDGIPPLGPCGSDVGECVPGTIVCQSGLPTCVGKIGPQPETCDGKDNDCNGVNDNNVAALGICGSDVGECRPGTLICDNGQGTCQDQVGPQPELCDGKDNDCNGLIDDDIPSLGPCGIDTGECVSGSILCQDGLATCVGKTGPQPEICDGKDNDCNGVDDDNLPTLGLCGSDVGECRKGTIVCQAGQTVCVGRYDGDLEVCDGQDNDCDGVADNNITGIGTPCPGNTTGSCFPGILTCANGIEVCTGKVEATYEHCDNLDTDCDGSPDPAACLFPAAGREQRLDELNTSTLGYHNSAHLDVAGLGQNLLAVWLDRRNGRSDIYGQGSMDGGVTWQSSDFAIATESRDKVEPKAGIGGPYPAGSTAPRRAYVAYERYDTASLGQRDVRVRRLRSNGTWSSAKTVETYNASSGDSLFVQMAVLPGATSSAADVVAICWERIAVTGSIRPNIRCTVSINSGSSYVDDIRANLNPDQAILPKMAIDSSYIYLSWQEGTNIRAARAPIPTASSPDLVFASQVQLNAPGGPGLNPVIAADGSGVVIVAWEDIRASLINIRANRSQDHGATWGNDGVRVDNDVVDGDSLSPSIAIRPGGRAFIAWSDTNRGTPDVYVNFSDDGGQSWSSVQRLASQDPAGPGSHPSTNPVIAVAPAPSNNVYVAWEEIRAGAKREVYFNLSLNSGEDWNIPDARLNESSPPGAADIRLPHLWASSNRAAVIWLDYRVLSGGVLTTGPNGDIYTSYLQ